MYFRISSRSVELVEPDDVTSFHAQHHRRLHRVRAEDDSLVLRLLSERRDDLAGERTRTANRLHALFRDLIPGGAKRNLSAQQGAALLRGVHRRLSWACMSGVVCQ